MTRAGLAHPGEPPAWGQGWAALLLGTAAWSADSPPAVASPSAPTTGAGRGEAVLLGARPCPVRGLLGESAPWTLTGGAHG